MQVCRDYQASAQAAWNVANGVSFNPLNTGKVSGWLRLAVSQQSGGEWTPSIVDVLNAGSPMVQTDTDRRAAVGTSGNGFPTMVFDGTDVHLWPQSPATSSTTKVGIWFWFKPATVASTQMLYEVAAGLGGSGTNRLIFYASNAKLQCEAYISNVNGRFGATSSNVLTVGAYTAIYLQYDSSRGGDANLAIFTGGVSQTLTYGNIGAGGTLTTLLAASGNALVGGATDSDTPINPITNGGELGPNIISFNDNLTADEIANMLTFEAPT